jgi:protein involved in polysaccharide export with SLBB domain
MFVFGATALGFAQATSQSPTSQTVQQTSSQTAAEGVSANSPGTQEGAALRPFGFDLFDQPATTGREEVFPLPPGYRLGPGDRVAIFLLGEEQKSFDLTINVEGKVYVPPAGVIPVAGLTLDAFKQLLDKRLKSFFSNYTLDVMLLQPKQVQVSVAGDVEQPGKYVLSALQTVFDAVKAAGGPTPRGSMRDVRLYRDGRLFASVDLYEFLMRGEPPQEIYLEMGDRIFVPIAQRRVRIEGEVYRPAVFELKPGEEERLSDLIELAGDFTDYAYLERIEISRLLEDGSREILFANYRDVLAGDGTTDNIVLKNEDQVRVYSRLEQIQEETVRILGEVRRPGKYRLQRNMRLSDLILQAGSLTRSAYLLEAQVAKVDPLQPPRIITVDLNRLLAQGDTTQNLLLEADDQVFIRRIPKWQVGPLVEVRGEVMFPGFYPIVEDSTRLSEVLQRAGGFTPQAIIREARLLRKSALIDKDPEYVRLRDTPRDQMSKLEYEYLVMRESSQNIGQVVVDFRRLFLEGDSTHDVTLRDGDVIEVPRSPGVVHVTGRVARAGGVVYEPGKDLKYYLAKAGGLTYDGDRRRIKVIKATGEILDDEKVKGFEPGDTIWVPRKPERDYWKFFRDTVTVAAQLATVYLIIERATGK